MQTITYDQWSAHFEVKSDSAADADSEIADNPEAFTFYDNGAVKNADGDFVIKCDQVSEKPKTV